MQFFADDTCVEVLSSDAPSLICAEKRPITTNASLAITSPGSPSDAASTTKIAMDESEQLLRAALSRDENGQPIFLAALAAWLTVVARAHSDTLPTALAVRRLCDCNNILNRVTSELYTQVAERPSGRPVEDLATTILEAIKGSDLKEELCWAIQQAATLWQDHD